MATAGLMKENIVDGPSGPGGTKRKNEGATMEAVKNKPRRRMGGRMPQRVAKGAQGLSSSTAAAGAESEEAASLRGRSVEGDAAKQSGGTVSVYEDSAAALGNQGMNQISFRSFLCWKQLSNSYPLVGKEALRSP